MNNSNIQIRIDEKLKNNVKEVLDSVGLDFSSAIKIYFHQIVDKNGIPFEIRTENGFLLKDEIKILEETKISEKNSKQYINAKKLINDLVD